jgi:hypothetical protein
MKTPTEKMNAPSRPVAHQTKASDSSPRKDDLLCYCDGMGPDGHGIDFDGFRAKVWSNPDAGFEEVCETLNIGQRCTACLLNVESAYFEAYRSRPANYSADAPKQNQIPGAKKNKARTKKQALYGIIDALLPKRPLTRLHLVPVIAAEHMRTVVTLSNRYPTTIGATPAPLRYRAVVHDASGAIVQIHKLELQPGERADVEVTDAIEKARDSAEVTTGSCWVYQVPIGPGTVGSTRPHFKLVGRNGVSAVHAQVTNGAEGSQVLSLANAEERHFIHVTNPYRQRLKALVTLHPLQGPAAVDSTEVPLAPKGSALVKLSRANLGGNGDGPTGLYVAKLSARRRRRGHIMIADRDISIMSADHF